MCWYAKIIKCLVPIGEWLGSRGGEPECKLCGHTLESISHCFWNCTKAIIIWTRSLKIVVVCGVNGNVVWGSIQGLILNGDGWAK